MPSLINELMLNEMKGLVGAVDSLILVDPSRLNSSDNLALRKNLRGVGATLKMAKVGIIKRSVPAAAADLVGSGSPIAVVISKDMVGAAKVLADLAKDDKITVKGGLMDGTALDASGIKRLADLPSKEQLRGMLVNVLAAPLVGFVRVIAEIEKKQRPADAATPAAAPAPGAA